ncbi:MAG TPA: Crp/Fnr family transcriptional regulator [Anaerolineales bacterium]|nr:Crp/Fnr family transcriptional regulator [Anaerolineales bacterium]
MISTPELLARLPLFNGLTQAELSAVAPWFNESRFERDEFIFFEGDPATRFWVAKDGQVKIVKYGEEGKEIVLEVISPGELFGGATMLMAQQPATAQALSNVTALSLPVEEYKRLLRNYPAVAVRVIEVLGERLLGVIRMRAMASERAERRIAHILLKLASKFGEETPEGMVINARLSRQDIAELSDTTIETAIRVMSKFRSEGLVKTLRGGYVVITDKDGFRKYGASVWQ